VRVGLLIYGSLETVTGGYLYDRKLVEFLRGNGDEVSLITLPWRSYVRHLGDNLLPSLLRRMESLQVDVLLQDELNHPSLFFLNGLLRARANYPIVSIVHNLRCCEARPQWQNTLCRLVEGQYLSTVDGFVFNSRTTRIAVRSLVGRELPELVAYPAGDRLCPDMTEEQIALRARQPGPFRIVFLGNVVPHKELHTLIGALEKLTQVDWTLTVAGSLHMDKAYVRAVRHRICESGLAGRVVFLGSAPDAVLIDVLKKGHLLVVPSSYEGFGIAYMEGMGFGLPAIASTAGAAWETITPGKDGFLVPPGDSLALGTRLYELSRDRELLLAMSLNARRRYLSHPTWQNTAELIRSFLQTVEKRPPDVRRAKAHQLPAME